MNEAPDFSRDVQSVLSIDQISLMLDLCARLSGMRMVAVARVSDTAWVNCAVLDLASFNLDVGQKVALEQTLCASVRQSRTALVIDDVQADPRYAEHLSPRTFGYRSYIGVPILRCGSDDLFGTLVAIDPEPRDLTGTRMEETFRLFANLIAKALDDRERLDLQESTANLREEFIGVVGHDLRNPISAVSAGLRIIERTGQVTPDLLHEMRSAMDRSFAIIDNLLDLTRGRLGDGILADIAPVDLTALLNRVAGEIRMADEVDIQITADLPETICCDEQRMGQLVSNILANAVDHHASGTAITLDAAVEGGMVRITVANQGDPISQEDRARLFLPFRQGERTSRNGLGLGLYIASQIARAHQGEIDVTSLGGRTAFTLTMPSDLR